MSLLSEIILIIGLLIVAGIIITLFMDYLKARGERRIFETYQRDREILSKDNKDLRADVQKIIISQSEMVTELSNYHTIIKNELNEQAKVYNKKMEDMTVTFNEKLERTDKRITTILGYVMACDNPNCPTRNKLSDYLKNN